MTDADFFANCEMLWIDTDIVTRLTDGPHKGMQIVTNNNAMSYYVHSKDKEAVRKLVDEAVKELEDLHTEYAKKKDPKGQEQITNIQMGWCAVSTWGKGGRKEGPAGQFANITVDNIASMEPGKANPVGVVGHTLATKLVKMYVDRWVSELKQSGKKS